MTRSFPALLAVLLALPAASHAASAPESWPPKDGPGVLVAHYGEEHWNDVDGKVLLTKVVEDVTRYAPGLVTMSGDKANNGTPEELEPWLEIMGHYDRAGIPWLAAVGNHDRDLGLGEEAAAEAGGVSPAGDLSHYEHVFAGRPYPMGDAAPYTAASIEGPRERSADDPEGAASHFYVDVPGARFVYIDNSCQSITNCDLLQNPPDAGGVPQYEYLRARAAEAKADKRLVFVVMHQPTQDPGDQLHRKDTAKYHVMAKGLTPDNVLFEQVAAEAGVDGVFVAHIKGQFQYTGEGDVPYFIDGGAGGELYSLGPVGTDHGYWHGYRLLRILGDGSWTSQAVPILTPGSLRVEGPGSLGVGETATYAGFGSQPVTNHSAKVEALELRDPAPTPRSGSAMPGWLPWIAPPALLLLFALGRLPQRASVRRGAALAGVALLGGGSLAVAQQSEPTSTPADALPNPARIWTSSDPRVLAPVSSASEDAARNPRTQTADGTFVARCPGRVALSLTSGWESTEHAVEIPSASGPVVAKRPRIARRTRAGKRRAIARVRLAQPAVVRVKVRRRGAKRAFVLRDACLPAGRHTVRFRPARKGRYRVRVAVRSDRKPVTRHRTLRAR